MIRSRSVVNSTSLILAILIAVLWASSVIEPARGADRAMESAIDSIIEGMNEGSSQAFFEAIDTKALLSRVFDGLEVDPELKEGFSNTINKSARQLGENILGNIREGAYAKVLNVRQDGDKATALVRYDYGNRGFGYHNYELEKDNSGNIRIVDWFDYLDGDRYSAALRLSVVSYDPTASAVRGLVPEYQGSDEDYAKFAELMKSYRDKDYQKFYSDLATLSRDLRRTRFMHLLTCQVSRIIGDQNLYINAYRALSNNFGDDPAVVLTLLNYYFSKGDYDEVTVSLRLLQEEFGVRDAALLSLMSRTALGLRKADEAAILADEAISIEPNLESPYWAAINAHVVLKHYSFAVMTAKSMEEQFGQSLGRDKFEENGMYNEFVQSTQYEQWQSGKE